MSESNNYLSTFKTLTYTTVLTGATIFLGLYTINKLGKGNAYLINYYNERKNKKEVVDLTNLYEYKYLDEYKELVKTLKSDTTDVKKNAFNKIHEETPNGDVIMYYDNQTESFIYYCDNKDSIPYKYLETVARKYVLENKCLEIYVDMYEELKEGIKRRNDERDKKLEEYKVSTTPDGPFATFKNYNMKTPESMLKTKHYILKENANRYSFRGRLDEGRKLTINANASPISDKGSPVPPPPRQANKEKLSFSEFKKRTENLTIFNTLTQQLGELQNNTATSPTESTSSLSQQSESEVTCLESEINDMFD